MERMSLHGPSLYPPALVLGQPYRDWLAGAKTAGEYARLASILTSFPESWLRWADSVARRRLRNRTDIANALGYRMAVLWRGIVMLQESKFLCDALENALRVCVQRYCEKEAIELGAIAISKWDRPLKTAARKIGAAIDKSQPIPEALLVEFNFSDLTEGVAANWKVIKTARGQVRGFSLLFWSENCCRDKKLFIHEMNMVRDARNRIAHSTKLFEEAEMQSLFKIVKRWLAALNIDIEPRLHRYRKLRKDFLAEIPGLTMGSYRVPLP
jgi:hypothetical protein